MENRKGDNNYNRYYNNQNNSVNNSDRIINNQNNSNISHNTNYNVNNNVNNNVYKANGYQGNQNNNYNVNNNYNNQNQNNNVYKANGYQGNQNNNYNVNNNYNNQNRNDNVYKANGYQGNQNNNYNVNNNYNNQNQNNNVYKASGYQGNQNNNYNVNNNFNNQSNNNVYRANGYQGNQNNNYNVNNQVNRNVNYNSNNNYPMNGYNYNNSYGNYNQFNGYNSQPNYYNNGGNNSFNNQGYQSYPYNNYDAMLNSMKNDQKNDKKTQKFQLIKALIDNGINIKLIVIIIVVVIILIFGFIVIKNLSKSYSIRFYLNGSNAIDQENMECKSDIFGHCYLTLPLAKRYDGVVLGFSKEVNSKSAEYQINQKIEMEEDMVLYVISKKDKVLNVDTSDISKLSVSKDNLTCPIYNAENVCSITVPQFNKEGYENIGYTKEKGSKNVNVLPGDRYQGDETLYPVYDKYPNGKTMKIKDSFFLNNATVDIEETCPDKIAKDYTENIKRIESYWPLLFHRQKITFHGSDGFDKFYGKDGEGASGITFVLGNHQEIEASSIRCFEATTEKVDAYLVMVHELAHSFDVEYKAVYNKKYRISESEELKKLYNKYSSVKVNRPLSNYAYSSYGEFFAEMMTFYYANYIDTDYKIINERLFYRNNFPDDMKSFLEKYICLGKNNFDNSKCN